MLQKQILVLNDNIQVMYQMNPEMILVTKLDRKPVQMVFAGYEGLKELYDSYADSFSEETNFEDTVNFFKPNIKTTSI